MLNFLQTLLNIQTAFAQVSDKNGNISSETGSQIQNLADSIFRSIPLWITGGIVIVASFVIAKIVKSSVENKMADEGLEEEHHEVQIVAGRAAGAAVLTVGITVGLKIAGIDLTSIIAAGAFGIGFAMKDIIMNFLAGIIVLLQKQFTIGDWIKVGPTTGVIQEIQSRYTVIRNFDGTKVIIPNSDLFKKQVTSFTSNPYRRFQFELGVDLYCDLKEVIDVIYGSIKKISKIAVNPKPSIIVLKPGSFSNTLRIRCWVESKKGILGPQSALIKQIHKDFYKKGWSWPYPTQSIIFDKDVHPDVNERTQEYIKKHKHTLKKKVEPVAVQNIIPSPEALQQEAGIIQQQQQILAEKQPIPSAQEVAIPPNSANQPVPPSTEAVALSNTPNLVSEPIPQNIATNPAQIVVPPIVSAAPGEAN